jgi:DNA-directed RNA polymerase specialized sigma24 family protein
MESDDRPDEFTAGKSLVREAVRSLNLKAAAVIAFDIDGFTTPEIAAFLNITAKEVYELRRKARTSLRRRLAGVGDQQRTRKR